MNSYEKELIKEFTILLHDPILKNELSQVEKKRFNQYRHRLSKGLTISEKVMRECVERFGKKKVIIVSLNEYKDKNK